MKLFERVHAAEAATNHSCRTGAKTKRRQLTMALVLAAGAALFGHAPLAGRVSAQAGDPPRMAAGIERDAKHADRDAKRAERAAAREAKKKERAARSHKSSDDERSYAKAKPPKTSGSKSENHSGAQLGGDDPLEGL